MIKEYWYYYFTQSVVCKPEKIVDKIVIPDFGIEMLVEDQGPYPSHAILSQFAKIRLESAIQGYIIDNKELPEALQKEEFIEKYGEPPMLCVVEIDDGLPEQDLSQYQDDYYDL